MALTGPSGFSAFSYKSMPASTCEDSLLAEVDTLNEHLVPINYSMISVILFACLDMCKASCTLNLEPICIGKCKHSRHFLFTVKYLTLLTWSVQRNVQPMVGVDEGGVAWVARVAMVAVDEEGEKAAMAEEEAGKVVTADVAVRMAVMAVVVAGMAGEVGRN